MIPVEYRRAARMHFDMPRVMQAHRLPMAHRDPDPESFWKVAAVYLGGIIIGLAALYVFGGPG